MPTTYNYEGTEFSLDNELWQDYLFDAADEFNNGTELIHRIEAICDSDELQTRFINELSQKVTNAVLLDIATCESVQDFLRKREELARSGAVIIIVNPTKMFERIDAPTLEAKMSKFYNLSINFLRDSLKNDEVPLKEIMFFSNQEYRDYIKHAYDIASMSRVFSLNKALVSKNSTLDNILESEYLGTLK